MSIGLKLNVDPVTKEALEKARPEIEATINDPAIWEENADDGPTHVVVDMSGAGGSSFVCLNCGAVERPGYPVDLDALLLLMSTFAGRHAACEPRLNAARARMEAWADTSPMTPDEWLACVDTGMSSATIWSVLAGRTMPFEWSTTVPHDASDFGRCYRLLKRIAGWRGRLPEVAARHREWAPFVAAWDELTALYERETVDHRGPAPLLNARLRELDAGRSSIETEAAR